MTNAEIEKIDAALGCTLPVDYRTVLVLHADTLTRASNTLRYFVVPWTDADRIIKENLAARSYAHEMSIGEDEDEALPWPNHFVVVGTNGGGDFWFIDVTGEKPGLWFWEHESHEVTQQHASFEDYLAEVRRYLENPDSWRWQHP